MRKAVFGSILFLAGGLTLGAAPPDLAESTAPQSGLGAIRFGHDNNGAAMFEFSVEGEPQLKGNLLCAAEDHAAYPHIIIRVDKITSVHFEFRKVRFTAEGHLHDDPVTVTVTAYDGEGTSNPDRFSIKAVPHDHDGDDPGHGTFEAEGELHSGDIRVGAHS